MVVVLDTTSFVSGIYWRTDAHRVLQAFASGRILLAVTQPILREYARVAAAVREEEGLAIDPKPWLDSVVEMAFEFEPAPLRDAVCRDTITIGDSLALPRLRHNARELRTSQAEGRGFETLLPLHFRESSSRRHFAWTGSRDQRNSSVSQRR